MPGRSALDYISTTLARLLSSAALARLAAVPVTINPTARTAGAYYPDSNSIVYRTDKLASNVRDLVFGHEAMHAVDPSMGNPKAAEWFVRSMPANLRADALTAYGPMQSNYEYYPEIIQNAGFRPDMLPYDVRRHYSTSFTPEALGIVPRRLTSQTHAAPNDTRMTSPARRTQIVKSNKPLMPPPPVKKNWQRIARGD